MFSCGPRLKLGTEHRCPSVRYRFTRFRDLCFGNNTFPWLEGTVECLITGRKRRTGYAVRRLGHLGMGIALPGCREVHLVGKLLEEDRSGYLTLGDPVRAAGMDDSEVRDTDEAEDDAKVGALDVVGLHGRARRVLAAAGDDDRDLLPFDKALQSLGAKAEGLVEPDDVVNPGLERSRHVEVIHGSGDNDFIGGEQLVDKLVGEFEGGLVVPRVLL